MTVRRASRIRVLVCAALSAALLATVSGGTVQAAARFDGRPPPAGAVPPVLVPPTGQERIAEFLGSGVQVYRCGAGAWTFVEPAANLLGHSLRPAGLRTAVHFRGPSWESTDDGSLVEAAVIASVPVPGSIPQLLLRSTLNRGDGLFGRVGYLQRLATSGGAAPVGACQDGRTVGVPYRATYVFFAPAR